MTIIDEKKYNYIGDAVYAVFDGNGIELRLDNHENTAGTIYLDSEVFLALIRFAGKVKFIDPDVLVSIVKEGRR